MHGITIARGALNSAVGTEGGQGTGALDFRGWALERKLQQTQDTTVGYGNPVRWRGRLLLFFPRIVSALEVPDDFGVIETELPRVLTGEALEVELAREPIEVLLFDPGKIPGRDSGLLRNPTKLEILLFAQVL